MIPSALLERTEEAAPPTTEIRLRALERELRVTLPEDYREFLLKYNGGRPFPASFILPLKRGLLPCSIHFFLGVDDPVESNSLGWAFEVTAATRPVGALPIADDDFGNYFYLRWENPKKGSVYFGPTPSDGLPVQPVLICRSFSEWLHMLCDDPALG